MKRSPMNRCIRNTGPSKTVRDMVFERDGSCIVCGEGFPLQVHHRRPRGMGGTNREDTNSPSALVVVCAEHHAWLESNRDTARARGYLVPQHADPADVPIVHRGEWKWLCPDGTAVPVGGCDHNREACTGDAPCIACPNAGDAA